ncbi:hypothetical protein IFM58399_02231 [Aspergillus lentulus]|uniref:F-box domain-containing protein n=1 Tax=Aspergillus lentulus TaxID=293939 RepID=A0AAN6BUH6_ASPLE|nr:uncharacterized protein IFM58399_02231 [Aspergillus lentulus]KAF4160720.1 hypothetical protein CNMCM6069_007505 [Aspergillus lentulus]KAF4178053.1 hypothetical protein CNMCM7927_002771 [Aspergillus lentulus]KAF4180539.1 hypothetical protein CNMCM8060_001232 [Aspergillus lentulus]KAF4190999.1 hypothetical protein CNMCM8694_002590 [Aspergillus lentulus]KAF4210046.1 hypothetical protein CNMCM8927_003311 [Aspergillus lentulus]
MADSTTSILFQIPCELRLEIYRRVFFIYPHARTRVSEFRLSENTETPPCKAFEVYIHPAKPHASVYRGAPNEYRSQEDQHRLHEYRYTPQEFLAILSVSKDVYKEAMPLFYSETFFCFPKNGRLGLPTSFLCNIGPRREQFVRRLSFELPPLNYPCTIEERPTLKWVSVFLRFMKHVDILEIILFVSEERLEFGEKFISIARPVLPNELILDILWGFHHILALRNLSTLRFVGDPDRILRNPDDRTLLEGVRGKKLFRGDTGRRPRVVFEHPAGLD